jgi:sulfonate transport system permease protein
VALGNRRLGLSRAPQYHRVLGPVLLLVLWGALSATGVLDPRALPAPWTVLRTFRDLVASGRLQADLLTSAQRAALGMLIGVSAGVALALVAGLSRLGEAVVDGPVQIKRAVSSLALIPLLILWFGIGEEMKVVTVALTVLIPVYMQMHAELRGIDGRYVELAESVGLSRRQFITCVALPGVLPGLLLGIRLAMTAA